MKKRAKSKAGGGKRRSKRRGVTIQRKPLPAPAQAPTPLPMGTDRAVKAPAQRRPRAQAMQTLADAYKVIFSSPLGEQVKADLMTFCNVYHPIQGGDLFEVGQRVGERNVALRIAQMMGLRPEHFDVNAWKEAATIDNLQMA